jgi:hypothetical protein
MNYPIKTNGNQINETKQELMLMIFIETSDLLERIPKTEPKGIGGRPSILNDSEAMTMVLYCVGVAGTKTLKAIYNLIDNSHQREFPNLPTYEGFVMQIHRIMPKMVLVLRNLLEPADKQAISEKLRFIDGTELPVCRNCRGKTHKVNQGLAAWGHSSKGNFFGFKLHLAINPQSQLRALVFTPGNIADITQTEQLLKDYQGAGLGDAGYCSKPLFQKLYDKGVWLLTGVRKNMRKMMTAWQYALLKKRQKIEGVIDYLKEHLNMVSSFPRSPKGYFLHYIITLLTYQYKQVYGVF